MNLVTVLVNRTCGHCLRALEQVETLAQKTGTSVAATDITAHPEIARQYRMKSSPAVVFAKGIAYAGVPDETTFQALCHTT